MYNSNLGQYHMAQTVQTHRKMTIEIVIVSKLECTIVTPRFHKHQCLIYIFISSRPHIPVVQNQLQSITING